MAVLYGKIRIYTEPGQSLTIATPKGSSRTIQTTGQTYTDVILAGMEEYIISNAYFTKEVTLGIGEFKEVTLDASLPSSLETATWEQISNLLKNGKLSQVASVGDTKTFELDGQTYTAELVALNDGTGTVGAYYPQRTADFITKELYPTGYAYNVSGRNDGGWISSEIRKWINGMLYNLLPSDLKEVVVAKKHTYQSGLYANSAWTSVMTEAEDMVWLPTYYEVQGSTSSYRPGETSSNNKKYTVASLTKKTVNDNTNRTWWTSSPYTSGYSNITYVSSGSLSYGGATNRYYVPICFRLG